VFVRACALLGAFFCLNMVLITLSSFLSATIINLYMRADKKNKVPDWLRMVSPCTLTNNSVGHGIQAGPYALDVMVATMLVDSYLTASSVNAVCSSCSFQVISQPHTHFKPIAVETLGPINESAVDFLRELGCRISSKFQEE